MQTLIFRQNAFYFYLELDIQRFSPIMELQLQEPSSNAYYKEEAQHVSYGGVLLCEKASYLKISYNPPQSAARLVAQEFHFDNSIPHFFACHTGHKSVLNM